MLTIETTIEQCAKAAHEVNRQCCLMLGDTSQPSWDDAPQWQKDSIKNGVVNVLEGKNLEQEHEGWLRIKEKEGWVYGPVYDTAAKTHPCMMPYNELPADQRFKDTLFSLAV